MIEIRIDTDDVKTKQMISRLEKLDETLGDALSEAIVHEARKLAPIHLRTKIQRRKQGKKWVVATTDPSLSSLIAVSLSNLKLGMYVRRWLDRLR